MEDWYKSKTIWGFGLLGISLIGQALGVIPANVVTVIVDVLLGFLGVVGVRSAIANQ